MSKILIIEDEEAIADLERDYLELSGFEVEIANRGDTGLDKAMKEEYDLIILDLMLPEVDGFDICRQIREEKNTPIIMVSAKKDDIDKIRGPEGHDGTDFNAEAVKRQDYERVIDPENNLRQRRNFIETADDGTETPRVESVECPDDYTVIFKSYKGMVPVHQPSDTVLYHQPGRSGRVRQRYHEPSGRNRSLHLYRMGRGRSHLFREE